MAVSDLDRVTITRAIEVYDNIAKLDQTIHNMSSVIFEFLLLRPPIGGTAEVAWPRSNNLNHLLLFIISCPGNGTEEQEKMIRQVSNDAPGQVLGPETRAEVNPAGLEPSYHDVKGVYREHYEKLVELRRLYDPKKRFQSFF
ncbi:hypothetical protein CSIM01_01745 [Colletotrichum simmondsii]|uniref:Berberine/berberine-like domain-containing protein n=1 Tax=Colletotrichum simmondsii TaxID=703756 RepID=A0A135T4C3_9PEZI|nr:hypothetical protein CSIM01_01745 [Colletotrichum simmondsii]